MSVEAAVADQFGTQLKKEWAQRHEHNNAVLGEISPVEARVFNFLEACQAHMSQAMQVHIALDREEHPLRVREKSQAFDYRFWGGDLDHLITLNFNPGRVSFGDDDYTPEYMGDLFAALSRDLLAAARPK